MPPYSLSPLPIHLSPPTGKPIEPTVKQSLAKAHAFAQANPTTKTRQQLRKEINSLMKLQTQAEEAENWVEAESLFVQIHTRYFWLRTA